MSRRLGKYLWSHEVYHPQHRRVDNLLPPWSAPIEELQGEAGAGDGGVAAGAQEHGQQDAQAHEDAQEGGVRDARRVGEAQLRAQDFASCQGLARLRTRLMGVAPQVVYACTA